MSSMAQENIRNVYQTTLQKQKRSSLFDDEIALDAMQFVPSTNIKKWLAKSSHCLKQKGMHLKGS